MMEDNTESDITIPILFPIFQQPKIILPPPPSATDLFLYLSSSSPRQANSTPATTTPYTTTRSTNIFPQSKKAGNGTSVTDLFSYLSSSSLGLANSAPATATPYTATGSTNIFLQSKKAGNPLPHTPGKGNIFRRLESQYQGEERGPNYARRLERLHPTLKSSRRLEKEHQPLKRWRNYARRLEYSPTHRMKTLSNWIAYNTATLGWKDNTDMLTKQGTGRGHCRSSVHDIHP